MSGRGGTENPCFCPGGSQEKVSEGVTFSENCLRGLNCQNKLSEGGKMGEKSCPRGVELTKNCRGGHKKKTCPRGVKQSCFVSAGGKENTRFCPGG